MSARPRNEVLVIVPPNSNVALPDRLRTVTEPEEHSDWSNLMSLGALSLVSALGTNPALRPLYVDCTVIGLPPVLDYIAANRDRILAVCVSVLTANYESASTIMRHAKEADARIWTILGNDHFTALPQECLAASPWIDYGFVGNEVVGPFTRLIAALLDQASVVPSEFPSLVVRGEGNRAQITPSAPEPVFNDFDYAQVDDLFNHTRHYSAGFKRRISPRIKTLLGRTVTAGVPVDIGRGCVKFANDNACSFCSIQYGGLWRNGLTPPAAWAAIERAWQAGYDYHYLTADELPLTFGPLLEAMHATQPSWWRDLGQDERPIIVGYARADGMSDGRKAALLKRLGIRQVMIGMDAGAAISLAALNKPLGRGISGIARGGERLTAENFRALRVAQDTGMLVRAGFVLGHLGMTPALLAENTDIMKALLREGRDVISAVDIEVLSPEPGSRDYIHLTSPDAATEAAARLDLRVADRGLRAEIAERWRGRDVVPPEHSMRDYAMALMPEIPFEDLIATRKAIRGFAKSLGIVIGEGAQPAASAAGAGVR